MTLKRGHQAQVNLDFAEVNTVKVCDCDLYQLQFVTNTELMPYRMLLGPDEAHGG